MRAERWTNTRSGSGSGPDGGSATFHVKRPGHWAPAPFHVKRSLHSPGAPTTMGLVALPDEDVAARARSIFDRLRAQQAGGNGEASTDEAIRPVLRWDLLPLMPGPTRQPAPESAGPGTVEGGAGAVRSAPPAPPFAEPVPPAAGTHVGVPEVASPPPVIPAELAPEPVAPAPMPQPAPGDVGSGAAPVVDRIPPGEGPTRVVVAEPSAPRADRGPDPVVPPEPPAEEEEPEAVPSSFARPLPRVIAIANQKGGVGKTTTTVNLGASLAVLGYRVLVVDLDPQGNATTGLGINSRNLDHSIYDVLLHDAALEDCVEPTTLRNLFVLPSTIDLAGAEIELVAAFSRELRLRRALDGVLDDFDFVLIDCPPSLGLLTVNGLAAATEVLVPIQCEYYALEGLGQLLRNVNLVQGNLNPKLEVSVIVLTMYDARTKLAEQVAGEVRQHFGPKVCRNIVPRTVRLSEAPSFGQPIIVFDPTSRGSLAYRELAREVSGGAPQRTG